jgi:hypothetical protein
VLENTKVDGSLRIAGVYVKFSLHVAVGQRPAHAGRQAKTAAKIRNAPDSNWLAGCLLSACLNFIDEIPFSQFLSETRRIVQP